MSSEAPARASRLPPVIKVDRFDWDDRPGPSLATIVGAPPAFAPAIVEPPPPPPPDRPSQAEIEREAFETGYAAGERAGAEAAATRAEAMLSRLAQTLGQLGTLRVEMMHKTERQLVELALAIAARIIRREVTIDGELLVAMARVALDRLGETTQATIRLNPADYARAGVTGSAEHPSVRIVPDPHVRPGGCLVQSEFGLIDASVDQQLAEMTSALLGDPEATAGEERGVQIGDTAA
jgi:flagellar assembly protein FliH